MKKYLHIGRGLRRDKNVQLGYRPARKISLEPLILGKNARIRSGTVIYLATTIGDNLETGHHVIIREQNTIGDDLQIWSHSVIDYGCRIGHRVLIHNHVYVAQFTVIEDDVFLSAGVTIANDKYPVNKAALKGPTIRCGARIGVNVTLMPGVVIGENAMVGAGSVVTKDVPDGTLAYGVPAKVVGKYEPASL